MSIVTSREQRRQMQRDNAKLPSRLAVVPRHTWPALYDGNPNAPTEVWRSRDFLVQCYRAEAPALCRLSVNRTTLSGDRWVEGISWEELQNIKTECGFGCMDAVEVFPDHRDVVNVANMRHLWILSPGNLPFAWRALNPRAQE